MCLINHCIWHWVSAKPGCKVSPLTEDIPVAMLPPPSALSQHLETVQVQRREAAARSVYGESTALQRILSWSAARWERAHSERGCLVTVGDPLLAAVQQTQLSCHSSCALFTSHTLTCSYSVKFNAYVLLCFFKVCPIGGGLRVFPQSSLTHYNPRQITQHLQQQLWKLFDRRFT